jgi:high-affinity iron transporter
VIAVALVTSMIVWMSHHARGLKGELEQKAGAALALGSGRALVVMAFLAVLREGFETAVFLVSALQSSTNRAASASGATLGIVAAIAIGYGIYKGGVRLDLARFFKATGLVLVLVAAGLVAFAMHTGHEAGWITIGQGQFADLSWLIKPGSIQSALLTGMLGIQPKPTVIEAVGWLVYFIPVSLFVLTGGFRVPSFALPATRRAAAARRVR